MKHTTSIMLSSLAALAAIIFTIAPAATSAPTELEARYKVPKFAAGQGQYINFRRCGSCNGGPFGCKMNVPVHYDGIEDLCDGNDKQKWDFGLIGNQFDVSTHGAHCHMTVTQAWVNATIAYQKSTQVGHMDCPDQQVSGIRCDRVDEVVGKAQCASTWACQDYVRCTW